MKIQSPSDVGLLIRLYRHHAGYTQSKLAELTGTTRRWVSDIENGKPTSEIGRVLKTLMVLNVPLSAPLPNESDARPPARPPLDLDYPDLDDESEGSV